MWFRIGKLYKNYKRLKTAYGVLKKSFKAGRWLFGAYKKRSAKKKEQSNERQYERDEYVTREPKGWQEKASEKVRGWSENAKTSKGWQPPKSAAPYLNSIRKAEQQQGIPAGVLARLIYQECRYREDIICGKVVSSAGAVGIAQIVPRWHPEARPLDPEHSIFYAARYLSQLNRQFNDWPMALAAYNWGPGNVSKARKKYGRSWLEKAPKETRNYVSQIGQDTGLL
ncbi:lytic transglycosylase domain-containing protein [Oceanospirillum sanctuarii]|uniref:lytic transglycosylase domain-containing protein n=1 Tax=Oceanospirillum sanctuarii TaxID=1434821 RepID=UPI000A362AC1|nr:transglycosylase SLT domain-containing protein [Oceanospirillum sanctuarii]